MIGRTMVATAGLALAAGAMLSPPAANAASQFTPRPGYVQPTGLLEEIRWRRRCWRECYGPRWRRVCVTRCRGRGWR